MSPWGFSVEYTGVIEVQECNRGDFPAGAVVKNTPANTRVTGLSSGRGRCHVPESN